MFKRMFRMSKLVAAGIIILGIVGCGGAEPIPKADTEKASSSIRDDIIQKVDKATIELGDAMEGVEIKSNAPLE